MRTPDGRSAEYDCHHSRPMRGGSAAARRPRGGSGRGEGERSAYGRGEEQRDAMRGPARESTRGERGEDHEDSQRIGRGEWVQWLRCLLRQLYPLAGERGCAARMPRFGLVGDRYQRQGRGTGPLRTGHYSWHTGPSHAAQGLGSGSCECGPTNKAASGSCTRGPHIRRFRSWRRALRAARSTRTQGTRVRRKHASATACVRA
jgi:hypothetical protein